MKIGLLAFSTNTGLGYQTLEFAQNMNPDKVLIADLSRHNGVQTHHDRFKGARIDPCNSPNYLSNESCEWLVDGMDVIFVCETPLNYYLFKYAKLKGVKIVQQFNYEFLDYFRNPNLPAPDIFAAPTNWNIQNVENLNLAKVERWPVPVDTNKIRFRNITKAKTLVHIIGRPAAHDRNGTRLFLLAAHYFGRRFKYKVYLQEPKESRAISHFKEIKSLLDRAKIELGENLEIITDVADNSEMYTSGDILILPRKYGGLCLPMWEALSAGMPVIMPFISPNDDILPHNWLTRAYISSNFHAHTNIDLYDANPAHLMETIEFVAKDISRANLQAKELADDMSWTNQKPKYLERIERLCA